MGSAAQIIGWRLKLARWIKPQVPADIESALQQAQFDSVRRQVPMLLTVAALNTGIIMAVCAQEGMDFRHYGWMASLIFYCCVRIGYWIKRADTPYTAAEIPRLLARNMVAALAMITVLGLITAVTFVAGTFQSMLLIPMSLGFGAVSIAHCLYTLRPAAIGTVLMGLFPSSLAMILIGPFEAQMLGLAMISVGALMIRFVTAQYDQLIDSLLLAEENRRLAHTDPLTSLANRRATMAALDEAARDEQNFAVALIDLDGFKAVNDQFGHYSGDALLVEVAQRLSAAVAAHDHVGRLGGDEFIVLFRELDGEADCAARSTSMLTALCRPVLLDEKPVKFGASLGFAIYRVHGESVSELLQSADQALYAAKRKAKAGAAADRSANAQAA